MRRCSAALRGCGAPGAGPVPAASYSDHMPLMKKHRVTANPTDRLSEGEENSQRQSVSDRRTRRRLPLALSARIEARPGPTAPSGTRLAVVCRTRDISNHGAYLWSPQHFETGQFLHLTLEVPPDQGRNWTLEIQCEAEVVRVEPGIRQPEETGVAVRILHFRFQKVLSSTTAVFPVDAGE